MPGAVRGWILPPQEGGPLACHHVLFVSLAMAKQLPPWKGCAVYAPIPELSYICRLILLQLASLAGGFFLPKKKRIPAMPMYP